MSRPPYAFLEGLTLAKKNKDGKGFVDKFGITCLICE